jgi:beta,beta-carotene 9',10'-dioxygenase
MIYSALTLFIALSGLSRAEIFGVGRSDWTSNLNNSIYTEHRVGVYPPYLLRNMEAIGEIYTQPLQSEFPQWLNGYTHLRLAPGIFLKGMDYHFDGLATVLKFSFKDGQVEMVSKAYESELFKDPKGCIIFETGTGPSLGYKICFRNPVVNLLPINNQLWLTIDTYAWGRIDPDTLETIPGDTKINTLSMNAHPACDYNTKECFVQHPCNARKFPLASDVCFSRLKTSEKDIDGEELARLNTPKNQLIQHSHSPCVTPNFVVSKLDAFGARLPPGGYVEGGVLRNTHQVEDKLWMVMDRKTKKANIMVSNFSFVNNHFWNCFEDDDGNVVVDSVTATDEYLDTYFQQRLEKTPLWDKMFHPSKRCKVPLDKENGVISCTNLLQDESVLFDYPTYNPLYKMNKNYQWFYAIAPQSRNSKFFDRVIKVNAQTGKIVSEYSAPNTFFTEADFVPRPGATAEDDGVLLSVTYDAAHDSSSLAIFDAQTLKLVDSYKLNQVIPFHAHGIVCTDKKTCYTNP